jgi:5,10-methylenetetrahydromethanopterin reductase
MRFGVLLIAWDMGAVGRLARLGEEQGFDLMGCADAPAIIYDPYVALTVAALHTSRVRLGPMVTNPQTRHPLVLANQAATLDQLAPGRSYVGLGPGNAGVLGVGARPARLEAVGRTAELLRLVLGHEPVSVEGARLELKVASQPVPMMLAGSGPRSLRLAGRVGDLALMAVGATPEAMGQALGWVREGAAAAERDPTAEESWAYIDAAIGEDREQTLLQATTAVVARANIVFRGPALASVPAALRERVEELVREYVYAEHMKPGRSANYLLAERLSLIEYFLERFAIAGTPDDCRRQLARLRDAGLENVCFNLSTVADLEGALRLFGQQVFPALAD